MAERKTAPLLILDFARLRRQDPSEVSRLVEACETHGFFYLDLHGVETESQTMLADWQRLLRTTEDYFDQTEEIKIRDDRHSGTYGFKRMGACSGATEDQVDALESLKIARGEILEKDPNLPVVAQENLDLFHRFSHESHIVGTTILANLSNALGLQPGARFEEFHREREPSKTLLGLLRYPKQDADAKGLGLHKHTDMGSLTLLFSEQWGLQVLLAGGWHYVEPRPGHAVVNVGDMLRFLSGQRFHSCVHRVMPFTQRHEEHRYSIIFFLRPEDNARFRDRENKLVTAQEWHDRKITVYAQTQAEQSLNADLTGGMESNGVLVRSTATA
ncbi:hypothetical protein MMC07_006264 [Pseudocyphellaria aurata]|nr:hypothetical protein [Pseudocyphellaria aurata]